MRRFIYSILILGIFTSSITTKASVLDSNHLVKVTPNNDIKCVDYYTYKGELYCSTTAHHPPLIDKHVKQYEKLTIKFDNRTWQIAWGKKEPDSTIIEYVPMGEDIEHWNELITSQFFPGLQKKVTPKQFADLFAQRLKNLGYNPIITFLENSPDQVIVEFRIEQPKNQAQDELQMITVDNQGLYLLHYVIKKADMGQKNRAEWFQNLKSSTIKHLF
jgi:hypothetical protein